jgi:copper transport outer membrane protein MctB
VSLVAVFLALGMGTLIGSSFISEATVSGLERSLRKLDENNRNLIADVRRLEDERGALHDFVDSSEEWIVQGRLKDRPVVVVSIDTTPAELLDALSQALVASGARVQASVQLSGKLDLSSQQKRDQVAKALAAPSAAPDELTTFIVNGMAASLSGAAPGMVGRLVDAGLAGSRGVPGGQPAPLTSLVAPKTMVIFVGGPAAAKSDLDDRIVAPVAQALATLEAQPVIVAAAEPGTEGFQLIARLRDGDQRLVTVDGIEESMGRIRLILGLDAASDGRFGDYGTGPGASSSLPETPK